jgi:cytochrome bd-type quinol oxidase subunit 2
MKHSGDKEKLTKQLPALKETTGVLEAGKLKRALEHPLFLTIIILYSGIIGYGLTVFPPVRWPLQITDVFMGATFVLLLGLTTATYAHAVVAHRYEVRLFFLKCLVGLLLVWQFRLMDAAHEALKSGESRKSQLICFYVSHILLVSTMFPVAGILSAAMLPKDKQDAKRRYHPLRYVGIVVPFLAALTEVFWENHSRRLLWSRRVSAVILLFLALTYLRSKPWARFQEDEIT